MNTDSQWSKQMACFHVRLRCGSLSIITPVSHLANGFDVRSILHGHLKVLILSNKGWDEYAKMH